MVIVANTRKTIIRVAQEAGGWDVIKEHFPIGERMNEDTHVFDGSLFTENGQMRFFMTALPISICDEIAKKGAEIAGSIHKIKRMETIEHLVFRKFCGQAGDMYIFLPQDQGIRVLCIKDALPHSVYYISNNPNHREAELSRIYDGQTEAVILEDGTTDLGWLYTKNPSTLNTKINIVNVIEDNVIVSINAEAPI